MSFISSAGSYAIPHAAASTTGGTAYAVGSDLPITDWNGENIDTVNAMVAASFTAPRSGQYFVALTLATASGSWTAGQFLDAIILVNGVSRIRRRFVMDRTGGSFGCQCRVSGIVNVNAGDIIRPGIFHTSNGAKALAATSATGLNRWVVVEMKAAS